MERKGQIQECERFYEMQFNEIARLAFGALRQRRTRSALTIIGIAVGSSVILGLVASTEGLSDAIVGELDKFRATTIMVFPSDTTRLTTLDQRAIENYIGVKRVVPTFLRGAMIKSGGKEENIQVMGVDMQGFREAVGGVEIEEGRFLSMFETNGVVLGQTLTHPVGEDAPFAKRHQIVSLTMTQFDEMGMTTNTRSYVVQGILEEFGPSLFVNIDQAAFISPVAARALFGEADFSSFLVVANSPDSVDPVVEQLEENYGDDIEALTSKQILSVVDSITSVLTLFLGGIAAVSLVVASIGITNIMVVSVMERTGEIGLLKAIGFQKLDILKIFLMEALLTGILGGMAGSGLGILFAYGITQFFAGGFGGDTEFEGGYSEGPANIAVSPAFSPNLFLLTIGFTVVASILAGIYPSWRASRMDPVDSIRSKK